MPPKNDQRNVLLEQLKAYEAKWPKEKPTIDQFRSFVENNEDCFERSLLSGHVTGGALITDQNLSKILLTHHAKLGKWLQLGGHSDGHPLAHETALREGEEESGLKGLHFFTDPPEIFDIDIHEIPERKTEPTHFHYDARYLIVANDTRFVVSEESLDLKWFTLQEAYQITSEPSMHRQFHKLEGLKSFY